MTKRQADSHAFSSSIVPPRRKTRSMTRQEKETEEAFRLRQDWDLKHPVLAKALGLVMKNRFLYNHESKMLSFVSKECNDVWQTIQDFEKSGKLFEDNAVEVTFEGKVRDNWHWNLQLETEDDFYEYKIDTTEELLRSPRFLKRVFDVVTDCSFRAHPTRKERKKALRLEDLPVWGKDILKVEVTIHHYRQDSWIHITFDTLKIGGRYLHDWRRRELRLYPYLELRYLTDCTRQAWDLYNTAPYYRGPVWFTEGDNDERCDSVSLLGPNPFRDFCFGNAFREHHYL